MTSVNPVSPTEQQTQSPFEAINDLIEALTVSIRPDNTLTDCIVRLRNLHGEVLAALAGSGVIFNAVSAVDDAELHPRTLGNILVWNDPDCGIVQDIVIPENTIIGRCAEGNGPIEVVTVGNGLSITPTEGGCEITTTAGRQLFVRNATFNNTADPIIIPDFITILQYQLTGGGSSAYLDTTLSQNCSGGSGETQIGSISVESGDEVVLIIPSPVGASLSVNAVNIAGGDVVLKVNGVTKVLAKGAAGGLSSSAGDTVFPGGTGGTTPTDMASWVGGVGRRDSAGTAFGAGVRGLGSGCGGNTSSISGDVTPAGCGFGILRY